MAGFIKDLLYLVVIATLVTIGWRLLEIYEFGKINPNGVDTVIGLVLTFSLYGNLKTFLKE